MDLVLGYIAFVCGIYFFISITFDPSINKKLNYYKFMFIKGFFIGTFIGLITSKDFFNLLNYEYWFLIFISFIAGLYSTFFELLFVLFWKDISALKENLKHTGYINIISFILILIGFLLSLL